MPASFLSGSSHVHKPVLITPPENFVTVAEMKSWSRIDWSDEDSLASTMVSSAIAHLDGWTGCLRRCLGRQTWRQDFDRFTRHMVLPLAPVISITSVKYIDTSGVEQTVDAADYQLIETTAGPAVVRAYDRDWPVDVRDDYRAVRITYEAGYDEVPQDIKTCVMLIASHWFEHREAVTMGGTPMEIPLGAKSIMARYDRTGV